MARLEVEIGGSASGLGQAASQALGILENLQNTADNLKLDLFKATDVNSLNAIGGALTTVTGQIRSYTQAAIQGSAAFQSQQTESILTSLNVKLLALTGSAQIFGESVKNQKAQVSAYENAINRLLSNGMSPLDSKITSLKANIDSLTSKIEADRQAVLALNAAANAVDPFAKFKQSLGIIDALKFKIANLRTALGQATDEKSIERYNKRLQAAQVEMERLTQAGLSAAQAARRLSGGYNAVGLEFGRIIQDAPFAANNFGAIGNNITRLVEVIPQYVAQSRAAIVAQGGVATSGAVARASLAGLFSGFGGVTIAISALVAGYTFYQQSQQKAKREQDALTGATKEYAETLKGVNRSSYEGVKSAQTQLVQLKTLYNAYQDSNIPLKERKTAYQQIQQLYPEYFKNIAFEEAASAKTKKAYDELTGSIIATAKARAAVNLITKNSERQLENENKALALQAKIDKERLQGQKALAAIGAAGQGQSSRFNADQSVRSNERVNKLVSQQNNLRTDTNLLAKENLRLEKEATNEIKKGGTLIDLNKSKKEKTFRDTITPKVDRTTDQADLAGYEGIDKQIETIRQKYVNLNESITAASKKKGADQTKIAALFDQAQVNESKEVSMALIGEETRVREEIQRIQNESGVVAAETREKELAKIKKWYDEEVIKARDNADLLAQIEEGKQTQIDAVTEKYEQKRLDAQKKITDKIQDLSDKSFTANDNGTAKGSKKIQDELQKRLKAVQEYFNELRKLYANDPMAQAGINLTQKGVTEGITAKATTANTDVSFSREISRGINSFTSDMFDSLKSIGENRTKRDKEYEDAIRNAKTETERQFITSIYRQQKAAENSFGSVFSTIVGKLNDSLTKVFENIFQKKLTTILESAFNNLSKSQQNLIGGAAILGSLVSGITKKTSTVGQGAGGALKGAATGAVLGSAVPVVGTVVGAVVGGLAGLLGGIFGASKARKQEELEKAQLAEQQKQTKLLERQNALAYTASIIGRMTTNGVVTGVEVNEFGQLSTKISGQDMLVVLDRANRSRKRGT